MSSPEGKCIYPVAVNTKNLKFYELRDSKLALILENVSIFKILMDLSDLLQVCSV